MAGPFYAALPMQPCLCSQMGILTTLVLGVCLNSLESQPSRACAGGSAETAAAAASLSGAWSSSAYAVGVAAVFTDSALSGFATVYFEKMLKTTRLTVWDRNLLVDAHLSPVGALRQPERTLFRLVRRDCCAVPLGSSRGHTSRPRHQACGRTRQESRDRLVDCADHRRELSALQRPDER